MIRIEIDTKNVKGRLKKVEQALGVQVPKVVVRTAENAKATAIRLVPKDTKKTLMGIKGSVVINTKGVSEARVGFWNNPHPEKAPFVLPYWMTYSEKAVSGWRAYGNPNGPIVHFRSGNPRFLLIARDEAFERFGRGVRLELNKALK